MTRRARPLALLVSGMEGGGAARSMLKLANTFAAMGHLVDLVLPRASGPFLAEVSPAVRVVDLKARRVITSLPALVRYLRRERPRAMISALNYVNIVAIWARWLARVETVLVVTERNTLPRSPQHRRTRRRTRLMPFLMRRFYPRADSIVAVAGGVRDDLMQLIGLSPDHVEVIYNPIVTEELRALTAGAIDHPWFAPGEPPVVLGVGYLIRQKDFPTLIRAFAETSKTHNARLLILGEGSERAELESLVKQLNLVDTADLPGFTSNPYPFMAHASVFVLSSRWEGLPGALIEAMSCGVPLIATDCHSGPREILADGTYGTLVPVGDVSAMAEALRRILSGDAHRPPSESWQRFEARNVASQYLRLIERL